MPLISAFKGGRGRWICEFKVSFIYRAEFQDNQGYTGKCCLEQTNKQMEEKKEARKERGKMRGREVD